VSNTCKRLKLIDNWLTQNKNYLQRIENQRAMLCNQNKTFAEKLHLVRRDAQPIGMCGIADIPIGKVSLWINPYTDDQNVADLPCLPIDGQNRRY